jgi:hypothetical protein
MLSATFDIDSLRRAIQLEYGEVAEHPEYGFRFPCWSSTCTGARLRPGVAGRPPGGLDRVIRGNGKSV